MRRRHAHALFAAAAAACAALAGLHGARLHDALRTGQAVAGVAAGGPAPAEDAAPEVRFAHARALAAAGRYEEALDAYKALTQAGRDDLRRAALYNLGNLHLREARRHEAGDPMRKLALLELAKQSFRDLLRLDPGDWDARYNLERALWLAPEAQDDEDEPPPPLQSERAVTTMRSDRGELP